MALQPHSFANIAAEEGEDWREQSRHAAVRALAELFAGLFEPEPVFDWIADEDALFAWLNTEEAEREAAARGGRLAGAPAAVVRRVHDKAFALEVARRERLLPAVLRDCIRVFEPSELEDADALADWMSGTALVPYMERLPDELHESFMDAYRVLLRQRFPTKPVFFGFRRTLFVAGRR